MIKAILTNELKKLEKLKGAIDIIENYDPTNMFSNEFTSDSFKLSVMYPSRDITEGRYLIETELSGREVQSKIDIIKKELAKIKERG